MRDPSGTKEKVSAELSDRSNVHILAGDLTNFDSLKVGRPIDTTGDRSNNLLTHSSLQTAADDTAAITGGSLDYLIANAAIMTPLDEYSPIGDM